MRITEITNSTWYHGTTDNVLDSIRTNGLQPGADGLVWLTRDRDVAYHNGALRQWHQYKRKVNPVIVTLNIPIDTTSTDTTVKGSIDPKYIVDIGLTPREQDDVEWHQRVNQQRKASNRS